MTIAIAYSVGVKSTWMIVLTAAASVTLMALGFVNERAKNCNDKAANVAVSAIGFFLLINVFSVFYAQYAANEEKSSLVLLVLIFESLFFVAFGVVQMLYISGKIDYSQDEMGFVILSFTSKLFLSWMLVVGVVPATSNED